MIVKVLLRKPSVQNTTSRSNNFGVSDLPSLSDSGGGANCDEKGIEIEDKDSVEGSGSDGFLSLTRVLNRV